MEKIYTMKIQKHRRQKIEKGCKISKGGEFMHLI